MKNLIDFESDCIKIAVQFQVSQGDDHFGPIGRFDGVKHKKKMHPGKLFHVLIPRKPSFLYCSTVAPDMTEFSGRVFVTEAVCLEVNRLLFFGGWQQPRIACLRVATLALRVFPPI